jgi:hypothetical protein
LLPGQQGWPGTPQVAQTEVELVPLQTKSLEVQMVDVELPLVEAVV